MNTLMKRFALLLIVLGSGSSYAEIVVKDGWVRLLPPMVKTTAAYMTITSSESDTLLSASSPMAHMVELHQSSMTDGVMSMDHVDRLNISSGQAIILSPSGYHLMVMGLKQPLKDGDTYPIHLRFEKAGEVSVQLDVRP